MKFGIMVNRQMIDRRSSDPYGPLFSYLNQMEDTGPEWLFITPTGVPTWLSRPRSFACSPRK